MVKRVKKDEVVIDNEVDFYTQKLEIITPKELEELEKEKKSKRKEKKEKIIEEKPVRKAKVSRVVAITLLLFLIAGFIYFCAYWYVEVYKKDDGGIYEVINKKLGYSFVSYNTKYELSMLNDTYILDAKDNVLYNVLNKEGKVLFEDSIEYKEIYMDLDNELYVVNNDSSEYGNMLSLYKLVNGKFELVNDYSEVGYQFGLIIYNDGTNKYLYGLSKMSHVFEETDNVNKIIMLDGETEILLDKNVYLGNLGETNIEVTSTRYMPVNNLKAVGLYDFEENTLVVDYNYQELKLIDVDNKILKVKKNYKYALLDINLKKLLDYKYEYVEYYDDYILVGIGNKIGLMDKEYNLLVSPVISYDYFMDNITMSSYKISDNVIVSIKKDVLGNVSYETYIIKADKTVNKLEEDFVYKKDFSYTISNDSRKYNIYDKDLMFVGTIDIADYDFAKRLEFNKVGDTIVGDDKVFYDLATLKQVSELQETKIKKDNYELLLKSDGVVSIYVNNKVIGNYKYEYGTNLYNENNDGTFYYLSNNSYVAIKKVNE